MKQLKKQAIMIFIMFLHYPPTNMYENEGIFTKLAKDFGVEQIVIRIFMEKEDLITV